MCAILFGTHASVANLKHVRVVPVARPGKAAPSRPAQIQSLPCESNGRKCRRWCAIDYHRPPHPTSTRNLRRIRRGCRRSASSCAQRIAHLHVGVDHHLVRGLRGRRLLHLSTQTAKVVLQIIDTPLGIGLRILLLMSQAALVACASLISRRRVDAQLEPLLCT